MGILGWIFFGLLAGIVAKIILPGSEGMGWIRTTLVGIFGSFVGGFVGSFFGVGTAGEWSWPGFVTAVFGAILLLILNRLVTRS
ncbi:MAG: GlsB/YeaQ/YmgE family stress response membrane protein [Bdellovibrio sp.]|jgi:uncharacterized membrane protein YeaQ/YmgE (transglycosylase-associated protein family)